MPRQIPRQSDGSHSVAHQYMVIFQSEADLLTTLTRYDELVRRCVRGDLPFEKFCQDYNDFYCYYALDGHESDEEELALLEKYDARIRPHRTIALILGQVCSDEDAQREIYKQVGRFGSAEAVARIAQVQFPSGEI